MNGRRILGSVMAALLLSCGGAAFAQPAWNQQKGNCDAIFLGYEQASMQELKYCMGLWESYRDVSKLKDAEKQAIAKPFDRVWREGDPEARYLAKNALARLGFSPKEEAANARKAEDKKPERKRYRPHTAPPDEQKEAQKIRDKGIAQYKKRDYDGAVRTLEEALSHDPASPQILYDLACSYALGGDNDNAIENLKRLADLGSKEAMDKLRKARTDKDFEGMREDPEYKRASGFAHVKILNGMPEDDKELGDDNVFKLSEMLRNPKLGWKVEDGGGDKHTRDRPHIWFKEPSKNQAFVIAHILGHPKTRLVPIDWDSQFDLIVSWSDKVEVNKDGEKVTKYAMMQKGGSGSGQSLNPEKRMDQALSAQDKALKEPDKVAHEASNVVDAPERMQNKVDSAQDKVENTMKNFQKVGDKAGKLFK